MKIPIDKILPQQNRSNIVEDSMMGRQLNYDTYKENTLTRRLKGIAIWDPNGRDFDHPANRKKK